GDGTAASGAGVRVEAITDLPPPTGNAILGNAIFANAGLGIDLTRDQASFGVTANDTGDADAGGNNLKNFPVLTSTATSGATTVTRRTRNSNPNSTSRLEPSASPSAASSGFGEGDQFLGFVTLTTNAFGNARLTFPPASPVPVGRVTTATAT